MVRYTVVFCFYFPVITCNQVLSAPVNGAVSVGPRTALSVLDFSCNQGFTLQGSRSTVCQLDGTWSSGTPTCKRTGNIFRFHVSINGGDTLFALNDGLQFLKFILSVLEPSVALWRRLYVKLGVHTQLPFSIVSLYPDTDPVCYCFEY